MTFQTLHQCITELKSEYKVIDTICADEYYPSSPDLYARIQTCYQKEFTEQQRIIFILTKDFYKNNSDVGIMLQSLQAMINDIDISNFFVCIVSTNKEIEKEYSWILKNVSSDQVPFHLYTCQGSFQYLIDNNRQTYTKYQKLKKPEMLHSLTETEKHYLFESEIFCMMPWISLMITPGSAVKPCCESTLVLGDCSQDSLQTIWNSTEIKQLRNNMLGNKQIESCKSCYTKEKLGRDTLRKSINRRFYKQISLIKQTNSDGYLDNFNLYYLDARFNNLCNLSCRSCGPESSSSWHEPAVYIGRKDNKYQALLIAGKNEFDIVNQINNHIHTLDRIYFAGGEPLIIEQFYDLVEGLDKQGRHEVELIYNTNMTKSQIKKRSVFDLWKNFKNISIGASLDAEGPRGEYLRTGSNWQDVVEFRKQILEKRPDIDFYVSATTSIINALHLPDFHRSWVEQGLIRPEEFNVQMLFSPIYFRVDQAPVYLKNLIKQKYQEHLQWLRPLDKVGRAVYGFESILNYIENDVEFNSVDFWKNIEPLDQYYKTSLINVFPELADLPRS